MMRETIAGLIALVLVFGLVGLVSATDDFEDNVQNHWDMDGDGFGDGDDLENLWVAWYDPCLTIDYIDIINSPASYPHSASIRMYAKAEFALCDGGIEMYIHNKKPTSFNYFSFVLRYHADIYDPTYGTGVHSRIQLYTSGGDCINTYSIETYFRDYHNSDLYEIFQEGGLAYLYINGNSMGTIGTWNSKATELRFIYYYKRATNAPVWANMYLDDITTKSGIVGIGTELSLTGAGRNHTITEAMADYKLETSWSVRTAGTVATDYTSAQYDIKVKRATWDEWYNVTRLKDAGNSSKKPCGFVVYNYSTLFNTDDYGLYWFSVFKTTEGEDEEKGKDWLFYKEIGEDSYINIEETKYPIGSPMNISYWIEDPDFGANDYWIYIYDSSGSKVDEFELFEQAATHEFTSTIDWETGTCFAVLAKDTQPNIPKDPPDDIVDLAYDFTWLTDAIYIRGYTWDASNSDNLIAGTKLTNVSVNFTHNNDEYNAMSDENGYYEFIGNTTGDEMAFYMDIPIYANASKSGYRHDNYVTEIIRAGTYYIDLFLVPSERVVNQDNSSIAGLVLDLPFHQAIEGATVHIQNATYSAEMTTNLWGFYSTDNIDAPYNESFNSSEYESWVSLTHKNISTYSETVTKSGVTYYRDFDYVMNYTDGTIQVKETGGMLNYTDYNISYKYYAFKEQGLGNNTYDMWATKETFSGSAKETVHAHDVVYTLDTCDVVDFYEATLDECDSLTNNGYWGYASIYNESFNSGTCDSSWVQLDNTDLRSSSESVTNTTITFVKDTDYSMNYTDGTIQIICTGSMENDTSYNISYQYEIGNPNSINTTDYMEATGSLEATGSQTIDFMKTFTTPVDANVTTEHGYFYFYSKVLDMANITSANVTVIIGSSGDNTTDTITWGVDKDNFGSVWNLTILALKAGEESGTCNLSAINYFELKSTKSGNVTTKIDDLRFIEYAGWESDLELSADSSDKKEGAASLKATGNAWIEYPYYHWNETKEFYVSKWFSVPFDAGHISKTSDLAHLEFWHKLGTWTGNHDIVLASNDTVDYMYWNNIGGTGNTWSLKKLYLKDAYENQSLNMSGITWFVLFGTRGGVFDVTEKLDNIQLIERGCTYQNFYMDEYYTLTVHAKEMDTHNTITDFKAVWDSTNVEKTTDGTIIFTNITYGIYTLEVTADGFYTSKQYIFMGQDTEETVYLLKVEDDEGGAGVYYPPPHLVEFRVINWWGQPISDVCVTGQGYSTTMGSWDWVYSVFGYKNETQIHNVSMNDTTDSDGAISFLMVETIKYKLEFTKASEGIDETWYKYPKDDHYTILVMPTSSPYRPETNWYEDVNFTVSWGEINSSHAYINFYYNDSLNETNTLTFYINNTDDNKTNVWYYTYTSGCNLSENQTIVNKEKGKSFFVGFYSSHTTHGDLWKESVIKFKWWLDVGIPKPGCQVISIAFLFLVGCFFGATSAHAGAIIIHLPAWMFYYIGWLVILNDVTTILVLSITTSISVIAYITYRSRRVLNN